MQRLKIKFLKNYVNHDRIQVSEIHNNPVTEFAKQAHYSGNTHARKVGTCMIYANVDTEVRNKDLGCGLKHYIAVGNPRRSISLWTEENLALKKGMNDKIAVGINYRRRPCLIPQVDYNLHLFLYAETDDIGIKRGEIKIYKKHAENVRVISHFGQNRCVLAEVVDPLVGALIQVRPYGITDDSQASLYVIHECNVYSCSIDTLKACCEEHGIEWLEAFANGECDLVAASDWVTL